MYQTVQHTAAEVEPQASLGHTIDLENIEVLTGGVTEGYLQQNSLLSQNTADFTKEMDMASERERNENQNQSNFPNLNIDDIATS